MGNKSLKIALKNDRVERVEAMMLTMARSFNANLSSLQKSIGQIHEAQNLFYNELMARTLKGRWKRFKKWLNEK